jgi:hypothetical protein
LNTADGCWKLPACLTILRRFDAYDMPSGGSNDPLCLPDGFAFYPIAFGTLAHGTTRELFPSTVLNRLDNS